MEVNDKKRIGNSRDDPDVAFHQRQRQFIQRTVPAKVLGNVTRSSGMSEDRNALKRIYYFSSA